MAAELILTYMSGPHDGEVVRLSLPEDATEITLGRSDGCAVRIEWDGDVSRVHAKLQWSEGAWWLTDQHSTNGSYVGEFRGTKKVDSRMQIAPGQIFRLGFTRFRLEDSSSFAESAAPASHAAGPENST